MDTIWIMTMLQITSVAAPLNRPGLLAAATGLVRRALGLGLLPDRERIERLDLDLIRSIAREASKAGVGQEAALALLETKASAPARFAWGSTRRASDSARAVSAAAGPPGAKRMCWRTRTWSAW